MAEKPALRPFFMVVASELKSPPAPTKRAVRLMCDNFGGASSDY